MAETAGGINGVQADVNANTLAPVTSRYVNSRCTDTSESGAACTSVNLYTVQSVAVLKAFYHKKKHKCMGSDTAFKKTRGRENMSLLRLVRCKWSGHRKTWLPGIPEWFAGIQIF